MMGRAAGAWLGAAFVLAAGCSGGKAAGKAGEPASAAAAPATGGPRATLTGTVTYRERVMLPPSAMLTVRLTDVSRQDVAGMVLAEQEISPVRVPAAFALSYDPASLDSTHTYVLQARIEDDGKLRFINMEQYRVLTRGAPHDSVEVLVKGVP